MMLAKQVSQGVTFSSPQPSYGVFS